MMEPEEVSLQRNVVGSACSGTVMLWSESADLGRVGGRRVAVIIGWCQPCRGRATPPAVQRDAR